MSELESIGTSGNLLPSDGVACYFGPILSPDQAGYFFRLLLEKVPWKSDEVMMFGKRMITSRMVAWYGDEGNVYRYSGTCKRPLPWTDELLALKSLTEKLTGEVYNCCLLNLYHNGGDSMGWHSDDERKIVRGSSIASISLGAERKFCFKHRVKPEKVSLVLEQGSLLEMKGDTQKFWRHSLPKMSRVHASRINLTLRHLHDSK